MKALLVILLPLAMSVAVTIASASHDERPVVSGIEPSILSVASR